LVFILALEFSFYASYTTKQERKTMINTISCTPGQLPSLLKYLYKLKLAAFLWGEPGVGKSESVQQFAVENGMKLTDVRLTQLDAPDLQGLKWIDEASGTTRSYRPEFFPAADEDSQGIFFLDELPAAEPRMQATAYQLVLDRKVGPHSLPSRWMVISAGNSPEDGAICYKMGSALSDRFVHIHVVANPNDWLEWGVKNNMHPSVLSFIRVKPDFLCTVQGQAKSTQLICPSPRSWARVSTIMYEVDDSTCNSILVNGIVGEAAAVEFKHTVEEIAELPIISELMYMNPKQAAGFIPLKRACFYGLAYSLAAYVQTTEQIAQSMSIFNEIRLRKTNLPVADLEAIANELLLQKALTLGIHPNVVRTKAYEDYSPRAQQLTKT